MKIVVRGDAEVRVSPAGSEVVVREEGGAFGPLEMLAAALGGGAAEALAGWARSAGHDARRLAVTVRWVRASLTGRVAAYELDIDWRDLPALGTSRPAASPGSARSCARWRRGPRCRSPSGAEAPPAVP